MKPQYIENYVNGGKYYYKDKKMTVLHREGGPAVKFPDGTKKWYINNKLHREDGPAVIWSGGRESWYLNDKLLTQQELTDLHRIK